LAANLLQVADRLLEDVAKDFHVHHLFAVAVAGGDFMRLAVIVAGRVIPGWRASETRPALRDFVLPLRQRRYISLAQGRASRTLGYRTDGEPTPTGLQKIRPKDAVMQPLRGKCAVRLFSQGARSATLGCDEFNAVGVKSVVRPFFP